jgi:hypothetical protein
MMTREEILSIEEYCVEHKISHKKRLEELGIPLCSLKEKLSRDNPVVLSGLSLDFRKNTHRFLYKERTSASGYLVLIYTAAVT